MCADESKDAESKPFKAGSGLIALANLKNVKTADISYVCRNFILFRGVSVLFQRFYA